MKMIKNDEAVSPVKTVSTEDAVSPVIGVILMVAITVILAAVIAAFVFGMAGTTSTSKNVGITGSMKQNATGTQFDATFAGGADLPQLVSYKIRVGANETAFSGTPAVGNISSALFDPNKQRVMVTGKFADGSEQVLFDRQY